MTDRLAANPEMDLPTLRAMLEELAVQAAEPTDVTYEEVDAGGRPALWCIPLGAATDRVILYTHGGGFVSNTMHSHRKLAGHLAKAAGVRSLVIDYRLAPEHPFPAQLDDAVAAYHWLLDQGIEADHIATAGDSAGGNLATSVVLKLRDDGVPLPAAIVALSPWYDMECDGDDARQQRRHRRPRPTTRRRTWRRCTSVSPDPHRPVGQPAARRRHRSAADLSDGRHPRDPAGQRRALRRHRQERQRRRDAGDRSTGCNTSTPSWPAEHGRPTTTIANIGGWLRPKLGLG